MMNCAQAQQLASRRLDGELSPGLGAQLDEHLEQCAACKRAAEQDEGLARRFRQALAVRPEVLLKIEREVLAQAGASATSPRLHSFRLLTFRPGRPRRLFAIAAAAVVIGFLLGAWSFWPSRNEPAAGPIKPTLVIEDGDQDFRPVSNDGDPTLWLRTRRARKTLIDPPLGPASRDPELRLEIEHVNQRLYQPVNYTWH